MRRVFVDPADTRVILCFVCFVGGFGTPVDFGTRVSPSPRTHRKGPILFPKTPPSPEAPSPAPVSRLLWSNRSRLRPAPCALRLAPDRHHVGHRWLEPERAPEGLSREKNLLPHPPSPPLGPDHRCVVSGRHMVNTEETLGAFRHEDVG